MKTPNDQKQKQSGNVLIIVLIGVVMFTALSLTVSRSINSESTKQLTTQEAKLIASNIINYAQILHRGVNRLRRNGVSESDISFQNNVTTEDYTNANCTNNTCRVFHPEGGNVTFRSAGDFIPDITHNFRFQGNNRVATFGCETYNDASCSELLIGIRLNSTPDICLAINDLLDIENPSNAPPQLREWRYTDLFTGSFIGSSAELVGGADITNEAPELNGKQGGCFYEFGSGQNNYQFYYVLMAR